jgi:hypothetical protein
MPVIWFGSVSRQKLKVERQKLLATSREFLVAVGNFTIGFYHRVAQRRRGVSQREGRRRLLKITI